MACWQQHKLTLVVECRWIDHIMMKSQSSSYRSQVCGLPLKLAFSPSASPPNAGSEHQLLQLQWKNQGREEELWKDAQTETLVLLREIISFQQGREDMDRESSLAEDLMENFGRRIVHPTSTDEDIENEDHQFDYAWLTIHDTEKIALKLQEHHAEGPTDFLQNSTDQSLVKHIQEKDLVPPNIKSWHDVIIIPFNNAAQTILQIYDKDASKQHIYQYLTYRAIRTMEQVKYFSIPSQKKEMLQLKEYYCKQQRLITELERYYNDAFEKLDDYCTNVLGVESDTLPLFPEEPVSAAVNDEHDTIDKAIDEYSDQVASHVRAFMMNELNEVSERFLSILADNRKAIATAIEYYLHFTKFLASTQWRDGQESAIDDKQEMTMLTLRHFVTSPVDSLISEFIQSPSTRVILVSELHHLDSFLISRKRELSSRAGVGRDVIEAIDLAWTQHCITTETSSKSGCNLNEVTLDDISQFSSAVQNVLAQIVGDSLHAKRLRQLADVLGCLPSEDAFRFKILCRRAAVLANQMSNYQRQKEASSLTLSRCKMDLIGKEKEIGIDLNHLDALTSMVTK